MAKDQHIKIVHNDLQSIGEIISERNIVLKGADLLSTEGFTQVPNHVLKSGNLTPGAKLTYAMLLSYAWNNDYCFPGQIRLAKDIGAAERSIRTYLQELESKDFLKIKKRGLGKVNFYELNLVVNSKRVEQHES